MCRHRLDACLAPSDRLPWQSGEMAPGAGIAGLRGERLAQWIAVNCGAPPGTAEQRPPAPLNITVTGEDAAMDINDALDDLTDEERVADRRARAKDLLNEIARQTKQALTEQGIDTSVFFLVPNSGDAIITFGTSGDPSGDEWDRVGEIVGSIVAQSIGLDRVRCREVVCATTADLCQPSAADGARSQ